ncbi:MAG: hypothetical protein HY343_00010 [Lentisphaerae bacterium]|nr:hypothetical protein [Lentisphaerota bacterium]
MVHVKHRVIRAPIPATRDPFINTPLIRVFPDSTTGAERFWTSTWNSNEGTTAVLIDEHGGHEIHRFKPPHFGFYSAVAVDADTLWLCGDLSRVVRYTPGSRKLEVFDTGAPSALVFNGMIHDRPTGKLMAMAYTGGVPHAFTFDIRKRKAVFSGPTRTPGLYMRCSHSVGDGTWASVQHLPGQELLYWDPRTDRFEGHTLTPTMDSENVVATTYFLLRQRIPGVEGWCVYVPTLGWFELRRRRFVKAGPRPEREMTWMGRWKGFAFGVANVERAVATVGLWDLKTGKVREVCRISDCPLQNVNFTRSGAVVSVSLYGQFARHDLLTGQLQSSRVLDADARGSIDCMTRVGGDRVLGTTFITQRFWTLNLRSGRGDDLGRAAPGVGEIMKLCKVGTRVYMAAYTGSELVEYDPARSARFPENPRVVATPKDAMRPVAMIPVGRFVFYASNAPYGRLGCTLTRYDTRTGEARTRQDPSPNLAIRSLAYDARAKRLVAGTTVEADCGSAKPRARTVRVLTIDPGTLEVVQSASLPEGVHTVTVVCAIGGGRWMCLASGGAGGSRLFDVSLRKLAVPAESAWRALPAGLGAMAPTRSPGIVVAGAREGIQLWDLRTLTFVRSLTGKDGAHTHFHVDGDDVIYNDRSTVTLLEGCLRGL